MGIASRTKWEWRIKHPLVNGADGVRRLRMLDDAKLTRRIQLKAASHDREPLFAQMRERRAQVEEKAEAKHQSHIAHRRRAAQNRGWLPHASR